MSVSGHKPVQFRQKIEAAILPLVDELRQELAKIRTRDVLNHYQFRVIFAGPHKDKLPDGFWAKGRYVSALSLAHSFVDVPTTGPQPALDRIDGLVEKMYDLYSFGAIYEPGTNPSSEKEFLARLGLGLRVREPEALGFPEQFRASATESAASTSRNHQTHQCQPACDAKATRYMSNIAAERKRSSEFPIG